MTGVKVRCVNLIAAVIIVVALCDWASAYNSAPKIIKGPRTHHVLNGETVGFFCRASGTPAPFFTWLMNGRKIRSSSMHTFRMVIYNETPHISALQIDQPSAQEMQNASITCLASNDLGEARSEAKLFIYPKDSDKPDGFPSIVKHPRLRSVSANRNIVLSCQARGDPQPRVMWLKDGIPLDVENYTRMQVFNLGSLRIEKAQDLDQGTYQCVAENKWGVAYSYRAMVYVKSRRVFPRFHSVPDDQSVPSGEDVYLRCTAGGSPLPYVRWRQGSQYLTTLRDDKLMHRGQNVLVLKDVRQSTSYTCEAASDLGKIQHTVEVIVKGPGSPPENVRARALTATSLLVSWNPPNISNGNIEGYKVYYTREPDEPTFFWKSLTLLGEDRTTTITDLEPNTTYDIVAQAFTSTGKGPFSKPIQGTTEIEVPSAPSNLTLKLIVDDPPIVKVSWMRPEQTRGLVRSYKVLWGLQAPGSYNEEILNPDQQVFVTPILDHNTAYEFRVFASNEYGYGEKAIQSITTPEGTPSGPPQNIAATNITENSVHLTWDPPALKRQSIIIGYQITYYRTSGDISEKPTDIRVADTFVDLFRLQSNSNYVFKIKARTSKGYGPWSNMLLLRTSKRAAPTSIPTPKNVALYRTSPTSIIVTWDAPDVPVAGYKIFYSHFVTPNMAAWMQNEVGPYTVTEITGLQPSMLYAVRIQAKSPLDGTYGNFSYLVVSDYNDGRERQDTVRQLRVTERLTNQIKLAWSPPMKPGVHHYILQLQYYGQRQHHDNTGQIEQTEKQELEHREIQLEAGSETYTVTNLQPMTRLNIKIKAVYDIEGKMEEGPNRMLIVETLQLIPPSPKNVTVRTTSPTSLVVTWDQPDNPVAGYEIFYSPVDIHASLDDWANGEIGPSDQQAAIFNLTPDTAYAISVRAKSIYGKYGTLSDIVFASLEDDKVEDEEIVSINRHSFSLNLKKASEKTGVITQYHVVVMGPRKESEGNKTPPPLTDFTSEEMWYVLFPQSDDSPEYSEKFGEGNEKGKDKFQVLKMKKNYLARWYPKLFG